MENVDIVDEFDDIAIEELNDVAGAATPLTLNCGGCVGTASCPATLGTAFCFTG